MEWDAVNLPIRLGVDAKSLLRSVSVMKSGLSLKANDISAPRLGRLRASWKKLRHAYLHSSRPTVDIQVPQSLARFSLNTVAICRRLAISRSTLGRWRRQRRLLIPGRHWVRKNPAARPADLLWHHGRCSALLALAHVRFPRAMVEFHQANQRLQGAGSASRDAAARLVRSHQRLLLPVHQPFEFRAPLLGRDRHKARPLQQRHQPPFLPEALAGRRLGHHARADFGQVGRGIPCAMQEPPPR